MNLDAWPGEEDDRTDKKDWPCAIQGSMVQRLSFWMLHTEQFGLRRSSLENNGGKGAQPWNQTYLMRLLIRIKSILGISKAAFKVRTQGNQTHWETKRTRDMLGISEMNLSQTDSKTFPDKAS